jgi:hypothetical protein
MTVACLQIELPGDVTEPVSPLLPSQLVPLAYEVAETAVGRPLQPGDVSPCCPGDLLADHPSQPAVWCPSCGHHHRTAQEAAA